MSEHFDEGTSNTKTTINSAGSIREAGGAFARMGMAREEQYFYNQQKEDMKNLNETLMNVKEAIYSKNEEKEQSNFK